MAAKSKLKPGLHTAASLAAAALLGGGTPAAVADARAADVVQAEAPALFSPRTYQLPVWADHEAKVLILEFGRQLGKSQTMASWAVERILKDFEAGRTTALVTVLSNSKANGQEFALKAAEQVRLMAQAQDEIEIDFPDGKELAKLKFDEMRFEIRITRGAKLGRILVLAANPRTARGFSGHLILDEFAFHQDAAAIWEAAEPIISSRPEYLCRIASTHNGKRTLFYQMARGGEYPVYSVTRSMAWKMGQGERGAWESFATQWRALDPEKFEQWLIHMVPKETAAWLMLGKGAPVIPPGDKITIRSLKKKKLDLTPEQAEGEASDKRAYRQNYENDPSDDGGALIGLELVLRAERNFAWSMDEDAWSDGALARMGSLPLNAEVYIGQDVGRTVDRSAVSVMHRDGQAFRMVALLSMLGQDLAHQREQMEKLLRALGTRTRGVAIDFTGVGTGLCDELRKKYPSLILPVHFAATVPLDDQAIAEGRKGVTMRVTEAMANGLYDLFKDGHIEILQSAMLRDDLRRPGRVVSGTGRVSIAADREKNSHADFFWSLALAWHAVKNIRGGWTADALEEMVTGGGSEFGPGFGGPLSWETVDTVTGDRCEGDRCSDLLLFTFPPATRTFPPATQAFSFCLTRHRARVALGQKYTHRQNTRFLASAPPFGVWTQPKRLPTQNRGGLTRFNSGFWRPSGGAFCPGGLFGRILDFFTGRGAGGGHLPTLSPFHLPT